MIDKDTLRAALEGAVKPLKWEKISENAEWANSILGRFEVMWGFHNGKVCLSHNSKHSWHNSIADAYNSASLKQSRILSAIDLDTLAAKLGGDNV